MKPALLLLASLTVASAVHAAESSTPYIDQLKAKLEKAGKGKPAGDTDYIDAERARLKKEPEQSYIEKLKEKNPSLNTAPETGYIEGQKARLEPKEEGGAIQAVKEGRSDLQFKMDKKIKSAFGLRYGAGMSHNFQASSEVKANEFADIYGSGHAPDLTFFGEYQFFHSDTLGSLGIVGSLGVVYNNGYGKFAFTPQGFSSTSQTKFQFFTVPVVAALNYRFNLTKYICPFAQAGPALVGYTEMRNDNKKGHTGNSRGYYASAGVLIPLDWVSKSSTEDLYYDFGVKRFGLTIEYSKIGTFSGPVTYDSSGVNAGLTFEY